MVLQFEDNNPLLPQFKWSEALKDDLARPWKDALIAKPLGINVGVVAFKKRVWELWKPNGEIKIVILGFRYYLIKFDNNMDRGEVLLNGPWIV